MGAVIAAQDREPPGYERTTIVYVNSAPLGPHVYLPASARDRTPKDDRLPPLDPHVARAALSAVDLSSCRDAGVPAGAQGHAVVTLNPSGDISKVVVDQPRGLSPDAVECIGHAIGGARIAPFRGSLVTIGTTWYVPVRTPA